jgi:hypothetical protein
LLGQIQLRNARGGWQPAMHAILLVPSRCRDVEWAVFSKTLFVMGNNAVNVDACRQSMPPGVACDTWLEN